MFLQVSAASFWMPQYLDIQDTSSSHVFASCSLRETLYIQYVEPNIHCDIQLAHNFFCCRVQILNQHLVPVRATPKGFETIQINKQCSSMVLLTKVPKCQSHCQELKCQGFSLGNGCSMMFRSNPKLLGGFYRGTSRSASSPQALNSSVFVNLWQ